MKKVKYFLQFLIIISIMMIFKISGFRFSSFLGGKLFELVGPFFRSKKIIFSNLKRAFPNSDDDKLNDISKAMWNNYGRVFAEYLFIKKFRNKKLEKNITVEGKEILMNIKKDNKQVIFISGHFSNFELMAMQIEMVGIKLAAIYRPLNNIFLNSIMEKIRKKYICQNQIKKGLGGLKQLIKLTKNGYSTALMIDQRVTEGIKSNFFNQKAFTTSIPAQLIKRFNIEVVPVSIKRYENTKFKIKINKPINFSKESSIQNITDKLNIVLEEMIINNPEQWIWTHNRWK
mgnify:CR=1 FL=1